MKLALISDLHSRRECPDYLSAIIEKEKPDAVVCSGDITTRNDTEYIKKIFEIINRASLTGFFVWGNSDENDVIEEIVKSTFNIHLNKKSYGGYDFFGLSYLDDYPAFDTSEIKGSIFVTHRPPIKANLEIESPNAPLIHISGHLHKPAFVKKYPSTTHIQVPTLMDGRFGILETDEMTVRFKNLER